MDHDAAARGLESSLARVRDRIAAACLRAGRPTASVGLVAVSKRIPDPLLLAACRAGQWTFGENRVQDALPRLDRFPDLLRREGLDPAPLRWHFIGTLQANKARKVVGRFSLLHGVDSLDLARRVDRVAGELGVRQPFLLQVNASGEASKHGLSLHEAAAAAVAAAALPHAELRGFMAMARFDAPEPELRATFAAVRRLAAEASALCGRPLPELSLGMSDDYEIAVEEGATLVRVGTAVFGPRNA